MKKLLSKYNDDVYYFTGKLSDLTRQYSLAAIAIVWMFRGINDNNLCFPDFLIKALFFIILSLIVDLSQYIYQSIFWALFTSINENACENEDEDPEVNAPKWSNWISWFLFGLKIIFMIVAYVYIFSYFFSLISD